MTTFDRFIWLQGWIDDLELSTSAKACLAVLARFMNAMGETWPSLETIALRAGCGIRTVRTHLGIAEERGWISRRPVVGTGVIYQATTPANFDTTPANNDLTPANFAALNRQPLSKFAAIATTTSTTSTYLEAEEAREDFKTENEPESLDAFLIHVATRHGFHISIGQAMAVSHQLLSSLKTQDVVRDYVSIRIAEKEGTGIKPGVLMRILAQDAPTWTTAGTQTSHGGAPAQTSRIEVRGTGWADEPKNAAWLNPANHLKVTKYTTDEEIDAAFFPEGRK